MLSYSFSRPLIVLSSCGYPVSSSMTKLAAAYPNTAGMVPSTGKILARKSGRMLNSSTWPLRNSSSGRGRSSALPGPGFSVEYTTEIPSFIPSARSLRRVDLERGSSLLELMSPTNTLVGSDLQPAPMELTTLSLCWWQYFSKATLLSILSIASTT